MRDNDDREVQVTNAVSYNKEHKKGPRDAFWAVIILCCPYCPATLLPFHLTLVTLSGPSGPLCLLLVLILLTIVVPLSVLVFLHCWCCEHVEETMSEEDQDQDKHQEVDSNNTANAHGKDDEKGRDDDSKGNKTTSTRRRMTTAGKQWAPRTTGTATTQEMGGWQDQNKMVVVASWTGDNST